MRGISISLVFLIILFSLSYLVRSGHSFNSNPILLNCSFHFLGGFFSALLVVKIWRYYSFDSYHFAKKGIGEYVMISGALTMGALWEIFEYPLFVWGIFQNRTPPDLYIDTIFDLLMDGVGGIAAILWVLFEPFSIKIFFQVLNANSHN